MKDDIFNTNNSAESILEKAEGVVTEGAATSSAPVPAGGLSGRPLVN